MDHIAVQFKIDRQELPHRSTCRVQGGQTAFSFECRKPGFEDPALGSHSAGLHDHVDGLQNVVPDFRQRQRHAGTHHQKGQPADRLVRGRGMDGREAALVAGVDRFKEGYGLDATQLAQDDPVRSQAQGA